VSGDENGSAWGDTRKRRQEDIHLGEPGFLHKVMRRRKLEAVFLFVTSRCNSRCRTCFYHDKLNSGDDLGLGEMERISATAPRFDKLWLSGGEPFLREDLADIVGLFYRNNGIRVVNMPTNGLLEEKIDRIVTRILDECPGLTVHLNFSLDGLGETHDAVRGVPGNFRRTVAAMDRMHRKLCDHPRFLQNVATVITPDARNELLELGAYLLEKGNTDAHFFEICRGNPLDPSIQSMTADQLVSLHRELFPLFDAQADHLFERFNPIQRKLARWYYLGFMKFITELQEANLERPGDWGMTCTAGITTLVIDHNGAFRACEVRPPVGRLQDYDFDVGAVLESEAMRREIHEIGGGRRANCWCTHSCWIMSSLKFSPKTLLFRIPAAHRRSRAWLRDSTALPEVDTVRIEAG